MKNWDSWQTVELLKEQPFALRKAQEDLSYGQVAKAQFFLMHQIIGPYNQESLALPGPRRIIREDQICWESLLKKVTELSVDNQL